MFGPQIGSMWVKVASGTAGSLARWPVRRGKGGGPFCRSMRCPGHLCRVEDTWAEAAGHRLVRNRGWCTCRPGAWTGD